MKIAMWSGPRNLSTALMYSFASRADTSVVDEPLYAAYLANTGLEHPMRDEILASQSQDFDSVIARLVGPQETQITYQKQMTHHLPDELSLDWLLSMHNVLLLRHPARVVASYAAKRAEIGLDDLGFGQQKRIFDFLRDRNAPVVVIDSTDIRAHPEANLRALCSALGLSWDASMLSWTLGPNPNDGVWASHWYGAIHNSTGFQDAEGSLPRLNPGLQAIADRAMPIYDALSEHRLLI